MSVKKMLKTYLKLHTQRELAKSMGLSASRINQLKQQLPKAVVLTDYEGKVLAIQYNMQRTILAKNS